MPNTKTRVPVVILYNYYKSWTPQERDDAHKLTQAMVSALRSVGHPVETAEFWKDVRTVVRKFKPSEWIIFNWCEGVEDEIGGDARICAELDALGYTYTGNPPSTLKLSVQKGRVKKVLQRWHIPTPSGREFKTAAEVTPDAWQPAWFPAIVKPVSQHCSVAVTRDAVVHNLDQLRERVGYVIATVKEPALAESFVAGREINVGVWGNGRPRVLPLREIDFSAIQNPLHQMVTWDSKWVPNSPEWNAMPVITQPTVSGNLRARIEDIALKTYRMFECRDYARVDLRINAGDEPFVVDVNPNPDITADGGFAGACSSAGFSYGEAMSNIVSMAVARRNRKQALLTTMERLREVRTPIAVPSPVVVPA